jgi:hypothetical protein
MPSPPWPVSVATEAASCAAWKAEMFSIPRPKSRRETISSSGSSGLDSKRDVGVRQEAFDHHADGDALGLGAGGEPQIRVEVALKRDRALVQHEPAAEDVEPSAHEVELARRDDIVGRAADPERAAQLGVEPAAADEDLVRRVDAEVEAVGRAAAPGRADGRAAVLRRSGRRGCGSGGRAAARRCG